MQCSVNFQRCAFLLKPDRFMFSSSVNPFIQALPSPPNVLNNDLNKTVPLLQRNTVCVSFFCLFFFFFSNVNNLLIVSGSAAVLCDLSRCPPKFLFSCSEEMQPGSQVLPCHGHGQPVPAHLAPRGCTGGDMLHTTQLGSVSSKQLLIEPNY